MLHIYTANMQPATDYLDWCGEVEFRGGFEPEKRIYTDCCGKKRKAKDCVVQCYYDGLGVWCAEGRGCKNPQTIAAKRWREHMKRSHAQQARRAREASSNVKVAGSAPTDLQEGEKA
ncbi:MAG: hypothetical protein NUV74_05265 [Candidatus Brocadiaceae bacterium]|nr:hypothetical protein [Candidatus Brocadiaceae bacterium]